MYCEICIHYYSYVRMYACIAVVLQCNTTETIQPYIATYSCCNEYKSHNTYAVNRPQHSVKVAMSYVPLLHIDIYRPINFTAFYMHNHDTISIIKLISFL